MTESFRLIPGQLSLQMIKSILKENKQCVLDESAVPLIDASCRIVHQVIADKRTIYGINTGFGSLANHRISEEHLKQLQRNIVLSHACGAGELLSDGVVALILLLKINSLAQGYSGVRNELIDFLIRLYNQRIYPCVPAKGSVGASGDLVPLAHLSLPLLGEGEVRYEGKVLSAEEGLKIAGLSPMELAPKEGLALLNGLQPSAALCMNAFLVPNCCLRRLY